MVSMIGYHCDIFKQASHLKQCIFQLYIRVSAKCYEVCPISEQLSWNKTCSLVTQCQNDLWLETNTLWWKDLGLWSQTVVWPLSQIPSSLFGPKYVITKMGRLFLLEIWYIVLKIIIITKQGPHLLTCSLCASHHAWCVIYLTIQRWIHWGAHFQFPNSTPRGPAANHLGPTISWALGISFLN